MANDFWVYQLSWTNPSYQVLNNHIVTHLYRGYIAYPSNLWLMNYQHAFWAACMLVVIPNGFIPCIGLSWSMAISTMLPCSTPKFQGDWIFSCFVRVHFVFTSFVFPKENCRLIYVHSWYIYIYTSYLYIYIHYMYTIDIYEKLCTYIIYLGFFLLPNRVIFPLPFLRRPKKRERNLGLGQGCHIPMICPIFIAIKNAWWHTINPFLCPINGHWLTLFILTLFILTLDFIV